MRKISKIISIILLIALCLSMFSTVAFANDPAEEINEEGNIVNDDKPIEEVEPPILMTIPAPSPEITYPFTVTYHFIYKTANGGTAEKTASKTINNENYNGSIKIPTFTPTAFSYNGNYYTYLGTFNGMSSPIQVSGKEVTTTDIYLEADYSITPLPVATLVFNYRGSDGEWTSSEISNTLAPGDGWNVGVNKANNVIENYRVVQTGVTRYTFTGWDISFPVKFSKITEDTTITTTAQYNVEILANLTVNRIDNIGNGGGSWASENSFESYTHTFITPPDIPDHYTFLYWDGDNGKTYVENNQFSVNSADLTGNTTYNFTATYLYQPAVQINYHYADGVISVTQYEDIDIYDNAPANLKWFYEGEDTPIAEGTKATLPEAIMTTTERTDIKVVDVYAKYFTITWINDNGTVLETDENVPYGEMPVYNGDTPIKTKTAQYTYTFNSWTPEIVPVTENATYKATYDATINIYTVTFKNYNGAILSAIQYPYGTKAAQIAIPTASRPATAQYTYTFAGWDKMIVDVTSDATYTAMYDATVNKYLITFLNYDGKILSERYYAYGTKAADITVPVATRENTAQYTYEFAGWDRPIADVTENAVYIARYNSDLNKYTVVWVNDDNTILETDKNVLYGTIPTYNSKTPTKTANAQYTYTFAGWTPTIVAVTGNAVYTAKYTANLRQYLVTFNPGDHGTFAPQMTYVPYGGSTPAAPNPTGEDGWEFTGWDLPIGNIVYGNVTFTAQWKPITPEPTPTTPLEDDTIRTIEDIEDPDTPLAGPAYWALINLILLVLTILALLKINKKKYTIVSPIAVIGALILFILTENVHNPMIWVDKWTIWQLFIYIITILSRWIAPSDEEEENNVEEVIEKQE